jgi:hypothetical protein
MYSPTGIPGVATQFAARLKASGGSPSRYASRSVLVSSMGGQPAPQQADALGPADDADLQRLCLPVPRVVAGGHQDVAARVGQEGREVLGLVGMLLAE